MSLKQITLKKVFKAKRNSTRAFQILSMSTLQWWNDNALFEFQIISEYAFWFHSSRGTVITDALKRKWANGKDD